MRVTSYMLLLPLFVAMARSDDDYESFISSLSYNWQNEFSDLRYQVDQLQKDDPQKYQALALALGLKPGMAIDVPSQYNAMWASQFVQAAGLYTPPAPKPATTFDETKATPTKDSSDSINISISVPTPSATSTGDNSSKDAESSDGESKSGKGNSKKPSSDSDDSAADDDDDDASSSHSKSKNTSVQYGNPVVSNLNFQTQGVKPTGTGYNGAPSHTAPFTAGALALVALTILF
ncbi:hypothetical protein FBU59_002390 [Linderina macrospora]|uniref:Uncharacterized protein n=1 Tax=Linderina macrospora TaxID=4868 RepID=A0ACC1JBK4_9FUNG|nr:hypothetical protein FBU59_002390 [Linderina macrospora]